MKIRTFLPTSTIAAALIIGCTWGTYDGSYTGGPPDGSNVGTALASATIDGTGGKLSSTDGILTIDIPAGALMGPIQLTIQLDNAMQSSGIGPTYSVGPMSTIFQKPIGVLFHETLGMLPSPGAYSVSSNNQAVALGGSTSDDRGPLIFGVVDHLAQFGVIQSPTMASSAGCSGSPNEDTCGACAKNACAMQNGQTASGSNMRNCLCLIPSRGDGIVEAFEGCAAMKEGATNCMATGNDMPPGGMPSSPGFIACGGSQCNKSSGQSCCGNAPNPPTCTMSGCSGPLLTCDEAADCPGPASAAACCGQASGASCIARNTCNGVGQFQYCRTNSECPSNNCVVKMAGPCILETCDGATPPGWPPAGCM